MANAKRPKPIRLTNRTAIGLRKSAQRVRSIWLVAMGIVTMICTVLAVYLGFSWLPAVPLTLMGGGVLITVMMILSRSQYLLLISQAICTEAASRQMEEHQSEQRRRERAIEQLAAMRADVREAQKNGLVREGVSGEAAILFDLLTGNEPSEEEILRNRRREEDEEMYSVSYLGDDEEELDAQEDLLPEKKSKRPLPEMPASKDVGGNTRPLMKAVKIETPAEPEKSEGEETGNRRRRRRSAPTGTAPLQLIRNDQAQ